MDHQGISYSKYFSKYLLATLGTEIEDDSVQTFGIQVLRMPHIPSQ